MSYYRTRTYIAGDWDNDKDAVDQLCKWNESNHWSISFTNAHDLMSSKDSSLNCSIKTSLKTRMDASKTFVLIVGDHTNSATAGSCRWCNSYNSHTCCCAKGYNVDFRSFIRFECDKAVNAGIKVIVLYKSTRVDKKKCPEIVKDKGTHLPMIMKTSEGKYCWDYQAVNKAFNV